VSFQISAPYPNIQTTSLLPNPNFSDAEGATVELEIIRSMDGSKKVFRKTKNSRRKLVWSFTLKRLKALELREFVRAYFRSKCLIIDHNNRKWQGYLTSNPFNFSNDERAAPARGDVRSENTSIELEFEGVEINGS